MRTDGRAELADGWKKSDDEIKTFFGFSSIISTFMLMNWSKIKPSGIVHIFALLHAAVTILCREAGIGDELFLTVLTMTMILLVCLKKNLNLELTAGIIIVINVTGYLLGTAGADLIGLLFSSELAVHAISTAFTTELLGWCTILVGDILKRLHLVSNTTRMPHLPWLIAVVCAIFLFRLSIIAFSDMNIISDGGLYRNLLRLLYNVPVCIILVCLNIIYVRFARTRLGKKPAYVRWTALTSFLILAVTGSAFAVGIGLPFAIQPLPPAHDIAETAVVVFIAEMLFYALTYMADYVWVTHQDVRAEKTKRHKAQFEYLKLKQQVNPHFLFNSLNVLDCLICENKNEEASLFVHKLSGIFRYMLKNDALTLISLREELKFTEMYADLLKVRFASGFEVNADVPESCLSCNVVPCSIQMLVENALKHNQVSPDNPLYIHIVASGQKITVTNNKSPKLAASEDSTKVGLNYIRQQYIDLSGNDIEINDDGAEYSVSLPLLPAEKTT